MATRGISGLPRADVGLPSEVNHPGAMVITQYAQPHHARRRHVRRR
ncbi:hypothetical protein KCP70_02380 [Salmonella enterica subsp. enterica]|nr:hypothetical protein KCP70_02380 [Salmonella enterica subsp. enterica]